MRNLHLSYNSNLEAVENMKRVWAPWRMQYVTAKKDEDCFLCIKSKESRDKENYLVYRGKKAFVALNIFPYNNGHLMVSPYRHLVDFEELSDDESMEIVSLIKKSIAALKKLMKPDGFNVGANIGRVAGAGENHFHVHVVPRWLGDTNFMPVVAETKVISEHLQETYEKLSAVFHD